MAQRKLRAVDGATASDATTIIRGRSVRDAYRSVYRWVAASDAAAITVAVVLASSPLLGGSAGRGAVPRLALVPLVVLIAFSLAHLYEPHRFTPAAEFRQILVAVSLGFAAISLRYFWSGDAGSFRRWIAVSWALGLVLVLVERRLWHDRMGRLRARGDLAYPTLIVGTNGEARRLESLMTTTAVGFRSVGYVTADGEAPADLPVVGSLGELRDVIRRTGAECVFVASSAVATDDLKPIAKAVRLEGVEVRVTATLPEVLASRLTVQPLGGITALSLRPVRLSGRQVVAKFTFDILISGGLLLLMSPVLLVIALAIKLTSPGPVLFKQRRVGLRGHPFTMLKFRTMQVDSEREVERLREAHGVTDVMFKLKDDPRVTKVGRWLRALSLDELPQLLNVIRGDMSLVGPRPPLPEEVTKYEDWHFDRLEVPPGITGLWQVSGRADLPFDDCVRLDIFYIENWSLSYDLYILVKTVPVLLSQRGAY